nr:Gfo/Idh/MocA family oxidoreductase [Phytoactinopolyspora alkaliphila]
MIGVRGYGRSYLEPLTAHGAAGSARFVAGCDVNPEAAADLPAGVEFFTDHRSMLARTRPDVTIVASPPHTHFEMAWDAMEAGSDVMLEKPPVVSVTEHTQLIELSRNRGRLCQIGFQGLAAEPMIRLLALVADGTLGEIGDITVTGQWIRLDRYYQRSRWAGHRALDGVVAADGVATNPLAHPVMNALAVAQAADPSAVPETLEVEAYRCRDIATDDTLSARIRLGDGKRIHVALTLCAEMQEAPVVTVYGTSGVAELGETASVLSIDGERLDLSTERGRPFDNLLAHRRDPQNVPLRASLQRTEAFTAFLEGMLASGDPHRIPAEHLEERDEDGSRRVILAGINAAVADSARTRALFSELGAAWARPGVSVDLRNRR